MKLRHYINLIEGLIIVCLVLLCAATVHRFINLQQQTPSFTAENNFQTKVRIDNEKPDNSNTVTPGIHTTDNLSPSSLATIFYKKYIPRTIITPEPEAPVRVPKITYIGKYQMDGGDIIYIFNSNNQREPLKLKADDTRDDIRLIDVEKHSGETVFKFLYKETKFEVLAE